MKSPGGTLQWTFAHERVTAAAVHRTLGQKHTLFLEFFNELNRVSDQKVSFLPAQLSDVPSLSKYGSPSKARGLYAVCEFVPKDAVRTNFAQLARNHGFAVKGTFDFVGPIAHLRFAEPLAVDIAARSNNSFGASPAAPSQRQSKLGLLRAPSSVGGYGGSDGGGMLSNSDAKQPKQEQTVPHLHGRQESIHPVTSLRKSCEETEGCPIQLLSNTIGLESGHTAKRSSGSIGGEYTQHVEGITVLPSPMSQYQGRYETTAKPSNASYAAASGSNYNSTHRQRLRDARAAQGSQDIRSFFKPLACCSFRSGAWPCAIIQMQIYC
jgi:hypothetical protein